MVRTKNIVSNGYDLSAIGAKTSASKADAKKEGKDSFKTMLDKNVQNAEKKDTEKKEAPENIGGTLSGENAEVPKKEENAEFQNGSEVQVILQYFFPQQERVSLNWAEPTQGNVDSKAVELEPIDLLETGKEAGHGTMQADTSVENGIQSGLKGSLEPNGARQGTEGLAVALEQPIGQEQRVETGKGTEGQTVVMAEEGSRKSTESESVNVGQEQKNLQEQKNAEVSDLQNTMMQKTSAEETLVQVKVGESVDISASKAVEQLADTVLVKMLEETNEFELQLQPEELGKIKIKLVIEAGKISIAMSCENQKAADILAANGGRLKAIVEERTGSETNVQVQQEDETAYHQQERQNQDGRSNEQGYAEQRQNKKNQKDASDFVQQLRLGLLDLV